MRILALFLIVYGSFILLGMIINLPFLYRNPKSKFIIEKIGKFAFQAILFFMAIIFIVLGLIIHP